MLSSATEVYQTVLVFRRPTAQAAVAGAALGEMPGPPAREEPAFTRAPEDTVELDLPPSAPPKPARLGPANDD